MVSTVHTKGQSHLLGQCLWSLSFLSMFIRVRSVYCSHIVNGYALVYGHTCEVVVNTFCLWGYKFVYIVEILCSPGLFVFIFSNS